MTRNQGKPLLTILLWFAIFAAAWLLWSGLYKTLLIALGVLSCAVTVYVMRRLRGVEEQSTLKLLPRLPLYWAWLLREVVKSSIDVTRIVLHPKLPASPTEVEIEAAPKGPIGQAILGNSIILTPGTLTLDVHEGRMRVHCLTREGAEEILAGEMNQRVARLTDQ